MRKMREKACYFIPLATGRNYLAPIRAEGDPDFFCFEEALD
jgi:hypothetical protein